MEKLDLTVQTLFADFQETVLARRALEEKAALEPTYVRKKLKGKIYWYRQHYEDGQSKQKYWTPADKETDEIVEQSRLQKKTLTHQIKKLTQLEIKQASMLKKGGIPSSEPHMASVLEHFSNWNLIFKGGILIGTLAMQGYSGLLGLLFEKRYLKTMDIDILKTQAGGTNKRITSKNLFPKGKNFTSIPGLRPDQPAVSFIDDRGLRVDFLTPLVGPPGGPRLLKGLPNIGAKPLPFLDFLIKETVDTVLIGPKRGIPVTLPHPARFAVHKIILGSRRDITHLAKAEKDFQQASQLILAIEESMPTELWNVFQEAWKRGPQWKKLLQRGIKRLSPEARQIEMLTIQTGLH